MPRKKRTGSGSRRRRSSTRAGPERAAPARARAERYTRRQRSSDEPASLERRRDPTLSRRTRTQRMQRRFLDRGAALRSRRGTATKSGLPKRLLPARTLNEDAPSGKAAGVCRRAKETRRSVIIATGYGGVNGFRDYKRRKSCR